MYLQQEKVNNSYEDGYEKWTSSGIILIGIEICFEYFIWSTVWEESQEVDHHSQIEKWTGKKVTVVRQRTYFAELKFCVRRTSNNVFSEWRLLVQ